MKLILQAKKFPLTPGVYLFFDKSDKVLYVGRAISLRRRILNYFQKSIDQRIAEMVGLAKKIKYQSTDTILEAIILEANLIKKYWPKYNIKDKDDRSFNYLVIPKTEFPRPLIVRGRELKKISTQDNVFGPYQSSALLKSALRIIRRIFPYSTCRPNSGKPCFDYQIGLCPGTCLGLLTPQEYQKNIKNIILLLSGNKKRILKQLEKENPEKAKAFKYIQDATLISKEDFDFTQKSHRIEGYDVSHLTGKETFGSMVVFTDGQPDKNQYRLFKIKLAPRNDDLRSLEEMITRRFKHLEWSMPDLILIDGGRPQINYMSQVLKKINVNIPIVGISKFSGDKLVFPKEIKKSTKELIENTKNIFLAVRDEAHRFCLKSSRRTRRIIQ